MRTRAPTTSCSTTEPDGPTGPRRRPPPPGGPPRRRAARTSGAAGRRATPPRRPRPAPRPGRTPAPAGRAPHHRGERGADRATGEVARHVGGVQPVAGLGPDRVDHVLVADVHRLHGEVQHDHADQQGSERPRPAGLARRQQTPRPQQQERPRAGHPVHQTPVRQPPGRRSGQRTGRPHEPQQPDGRLLPAVGRAGHQERDGRPQHAEAGEGQRPDRGPPPQHRFLYEQRERRAQQRRIAQARRGAQGGQPEAQQHRHQQHQRGVDPVDGAPPAEFGEHPGGRTGQQNAQQQPGHDGADGPAAFGGRRKGRRVRHQDLGGDRGEPGQRGAGQQQRGVGRARRHRQEARGGHTQGHRQPAPLQQIAERYEQQQPEPVADLGHGHHQRGGGRGQSQIPADDVQQRLGEVVACDRQAGGDRHQQQRAAPQPAGARVRLRRAPLLRPRRLLGLHVGVLSRGPRPPWLRARPACAVNDQ